MDAGFKGDDAYDVYDKAFRGEKASSIYRPTRNKEETYTDEDLAKLKSSDKFHRPDKGFAGADASGGNRRDGPVQFEKDSEDVFGLDQFLTEAKEGSKDGKRSGYVGRSSRLDVASYPIGFETVQQRRLRRCPLRACAHVMACCCVRAPNSHGTLCLLARCFAGEETTVIPKGDGRRSGRIGLERLIYAVGVHKCSFPRGKGLLRIIQ